MPDQYSDAYFKRSVSDMKMKSVARLHDYLCTKNERNPVMCFRRIYIYIYQGGRKAVFRHIGTRIYIHYNCTRQFLVALLFQQFSIALTKSFVHVVTAKLEQAG